MLLSKTESVLLARLNARGYVVVDTQRDLKAAQKLVAKGLAVQATSISGKSDLWNSQFGSRNTVRRQVWSKEVKFVKPTVVE